MSTLDSQIFMHHLTVSPSVKALKQELQNMHPQIALLLKVEIHKLLDVGLMRPIDYPKWVPTLVPITKLYGGIRVCIDLRDLNKTCPKDGFPLPNIDIIIDLTTDQEMLSLIDVFSNYNQINITPEDQQKIGFTCPWGTYYWNVMPFCLKNTCTTYQRDMTTIFHDMMQY